MNRAVRLPGAELSLRGSPSRWFAILLGCTWGAGVATVATLTTATIGMAAYVAAEPYLSHIRGNVRVDGLLGLVAAFQLPFALTAAGKLTVLGFSSSVPLLTASGRFPTTSLTLLMALSLLAGGWAAGRVSETRWAGAGVAIIYATAMTLVAAGVAQNVHFAAFPHVVPSGVGVVVQISISPLRVWFQSAAYALPCALLGSIIARQPRSFALSASDCRGWRASLLGAAIATTASLIACFGVLVVANFVGPALTHGTRLTGPDFYLAAPMWTVDALSLSVGASLHSSLQESATVIGGVQANNSTTLGTSLLGSWPGTNLARALLCIPVLACIAGSWVTLRLTRSFRHVVAMCALFATINTLLAALAGFSVEARPTHELASVLGSVGGVFLGALFGPLATLTGFAANAIADAGVSDSTGPDLSGVLVGSFLVALIAAVLTTLILRIVDSSSGAKVVIVSETLQSPIVSPQLGLSTQSSQTETSGWRRMPGSASHSSHGLFRLSRELGCGAERNGLQSKAKPRTHPQGIPLSSIRPPTPKPPLQSDPAGWSQSPAVSHTCICAHCGNVSVDVDRCPNCNAPVKES